MQYVANQMSQDVENVLDCVQQNLLKDNLGSITQTMKYTYIYCMNGRCNIKKYVSTQNFLDLTTRRKPEQVYEGRPWISR